MKFFFILLNIEILLIKDGQTHYKKSRGLEVLRKERPTGPKDLNNCS